MVGIKKVLTPLIDKNFRKAPIYYVVQSLLAAIAIWAILHFVGVLTRGAIVAALGASTFIVFAMPGSVTARPRRLIGGHIVGLFCGFLCYFVFFTGPIARNQPGLEIYALDRRCLVSRVVYFANDGY